jgi:hypothetical protein
LLSTIAFGYTNGSLIVHAPAFNHDIMHAFHVLGGDLRQGGQAWRSARPVVGALYPFSGGHDDYALWLIAFPSIVRTLEEFDSVGDSCQRDFGFDRKSQQLSNIRTTPGSHTTLAQCDNDMQATNFSGSED